MDSDDESEDITLCPLISDILRTRYCVPNSVFLLEGLEAIQPTRNPDKRALRMILGDGKICIQAILTADVHRFVDSGEVAPGCLLRLHKFELCSEEVEVEGEEGKKVKMVYLVVDDFSVVGWHEEFAERFGLEEPEIAEEPPSPDPRDREAEYRSRSLAAEKAAADASLDSSEIPDSDSEDGLEVPEPAGVPRTPSLPDDDFFESSIPADDKPRNPPPPDDDVFVPLDDDFFDTPEPAREPPRTPSPDDDFPTSIPESPPLPLPPPVALLRDWTSLHNPLKLTRLSAVPHLPYRQNWSINALVIIASLSPPQPSPFPPHTQREARLADPSTEKRVHLTVFLEPEAFAPRVGSVVLLAGVKNHLFDGGSLKKYASDRPRNGISWWFEEPRFGWCRGEVRELREWWASPVVRDEEG